MPNHFYARLQADGEHRPLQMVCNVCVRERVFGGFYVRQRDVEDAVPDNSLQACCKFAMRNTATPNNTFYRFPQPPNHPQPNIS